MGLFLNSCTNDEKPIVGANIYAFIDILLKDKNGNDLLGTSNYPENKIYANYLINGKIVQNDNNGNILDNPSNISIIKQSGNHSAHINLNISNAEEYPITYIHWNETDTDTIKAQYTRAENSILLNKCWIYKNSTWEEIKVLSGYTIVK
jgi:hypothetical protein